MYEYQKRGNQFSFFVVEAGQDIPAGQLQLDIQGELIISYEADDLAGRLRSLICNKVNKGGLTVAAFEQILQAAEVTPR